MTHLKYPDPEHGIHLKAHISLLRKLVKFDTTLVKNILSTNEVAEFCKNWITGHILTIDKKLGAFMLKNAKRYFLES